MRTRTIFEFSFRMGLTICVQFEAIHHHIEWLKPTGLSIPHNIHSFSLVLQLNIFAFEVFALFARKQNMKKKKNGSHFSAEFVNYLPRM